MKLNEIALIRGEYFDTLLDLNDKNTHCCFLFQLIGYLKIRDIVWRGREMLGHLVSIVEVAFEHFFGEEFINAVILLSVLLVQAFVVMRKGIQYVVVRSHCMFFIPIMAMLFCKNFPNCIAVMTQIADSIRY